MARSRVFGSFLYFALGLRKLGLPGARVPQIGRVGVLEGLKRTGGVSCVGGLDLIETLGGAVLLSGFGHCVLLVNGGVDCRVVPH